MGERDCVSWLPDGYSRIFRIICVWPFGLEGLWLRYAALQNLIPSFPWIAPPHPPPRHNPRKGRDQILPSGNLAVCDCGKGKKTFWHGHTDEQRVHNVNSREREVCNGRPRPEAVVNKNQDSDGREKLLLSTNKRRWRSISRV